MLVVLRMTFLVNRMEQIRLGNCKQALMSHKDAISANSPIGIQIFMKA